MIKLTRSFFHVSSLSQPRTSNGIHPLIITSSVHCVNKSIVVLFFAASSYHSFAGGNMKHLLRVFALLFIQALGAIDEWLCLNLPWFLRLPWCSLWIRDGALHPSLAYDDAALFEKARFISFWEGLRIRYETLLDGEDQATKKSERHKKIRDRIDAIRAEYEIDLARRLDIARSRDTKNSS